MVALKFHATSSRDSGKHNGRDRNCAVCKVCAKCNIVCVIGQELLFDDELKEINIWSSLARRLTLKILQVLVKTAIKFKIRYFFERLIAGVSRRRPVSFAIDE